MTVIPDIAYVKIQNSFQLLSQWVLHHVQHHGLWGGGEGKRKEDRRRGDRVRRGRGRKGGRCEDKPTPIATNCIATELHVYVHGASQILTDLIIELGHNMLTSCSMWFPQTARYRYVYVHVTNTPWHRIFHHTWRHCSLVVSESDVTESWAILYIRSYMLSTNSLRPRITCTGAKYTQSITVAKETK